VIILTSIEQATLRALADACNYSLHAHVPTEAVTCRVAKNLRGEAKHALKELRKKGLCLKHPTGRSTTWQLTLEGLTTARSI
jgi:hypothetical protein